MQQVAANKLQLQQQQGHVAGVIRTHSQRTLDSQAATLEAWQRAAGVEIMRTCSHQEGRQFETDITDQVLTELDTLEQEVVAPWTPLAASSMGSRPKRRLPESVLQLPPQALSYHKVEHECQDVLVRMSRCRLVGLCSLHAARATVSAPLPSPSPSLSMYIFAHTCSTSFTLSLPHSPGPPNPPHTFPPLFLLRLEEAVQNMSRGMTLLVQQLRENREGTCQTPEIKNASENAASYLCGAGKLDVKRNRTSECNNADYILQQYYGI